MKIFRLFILSIFFLAIFFSCSTKKKPGRHITLELKKERTTKLNSLAEDIFQDAIASDTLTRKKLFFVFLTGNTNKFSKLNDTLKILGFDNSQIGSTPHNTYQGITIEEGYRSKYGFRDHIYVNHPVMPHNIQFSEDTVKAHIDRMMEIAYIKDCDLYTWGFIGDNENELILLQ